MSLISLRIYQCWLCARVLFARLCAVFTPKVDLWLISERGKEARDNGYAFYRWMKDNHPEVTVKYVITRDSKDFHKIESEDVVEYNTFSHLLYIWKAKFLISTHIMGYMPDHSTYARLELRLRLLKSRKKVFLQHGIIYNGLDSLYYGNVDLNLFICGSQIEYNYVDSTFGYPSGIVKYTGLCRYDNLLQYSASKQILIMPTFRIFIDKQHFEDTQYYNEYKGLLCCKQFHDLLEKYDYRVVFYPHYEFQCKIESFKCLPISDRITIADMNYDVQQLLKESSVLLTDYSSVFFDMMYMNKPILFYQFDIERYRTEHYKSGYLNYEDVGPVVDNLSGLLRNIENLLQNNEDISQYQSYYAKTFTKRDTRNCERVYDAIRYC